MSYFVKNSNLSSIQEIVDSFTEVITQQNALISTLLNRIVSNEAALVGLTTITTTQGSAIGVLQSTFATNGSAIGVLQSAYSTNTTAIATNTAAILALQGV